MSRCWTPIKNQTWPTDVKQLIGHTTHILRLPLCSLTWPINAKLRRKSLGCFLVGGTRTVANVAMHTSVANASRFRSPPERLFFWPGTPMRVCCDLVRPRLAMMVSMRARRSAAVVCRSILSRAWNGMTLRQVTLNTLISRRKRHIRQKSHAEDWRWKNQFAKYT